MIQEAILEAESDEYKLMNVQSEVEKQRVMQEVQALVLVAQKCPRDEIKSTKKIMEAAKRKTLAEQSTYAYPRGGQIVKGASIRTAETLAKYWGNINFGVKELSQDNRNHFSEVMAFAWDLETNVRVEKVFKVPHKRETKQGSKVLTDSRDIYELVANQGARRLRACILEVLPSDIVEDFLNECEKTLEGDNTKPLKERVQDMVKLFEQLGVSQEMIEKRIGCKLDVIIIKQLSDLGSIYNSIKNNFKSVEDFFEKPSIEKEKVKDPLHNDNEDKQKKLL